MFLYSNKYKYQEQVHKFSDSFISWSRIREDWKVVRLHIITRKKVKEVLNEPYFSCIVCTTSERWPCAACQPSQISENFAIRGPGIEFARIRCASIKYGKTCTNTKSTNMEAPMIAKSNSKAEAMIILLVAMMLIVPNFYTGTSE